MDFKIAVPRANPPVRTRHNTVNAYFRNAKKEVRVKVYQGCRVLDEGFRLTKLKQGGNYVEDDSKRFQHITTAAGYGIMRAIQGIGSKPQGTVEL